MLTVWSVCVGDKYHDDEVRILQAMVARNLSRPHLFKCLSDRAIWGVDCVQPDESWPGWWTKLLLFKYATGQNLYFDLDVVITGPLDGLVSDTLSMPENWALSGHGGWQSSVMSWGGDYSYLPDKFDPDRLTKPENGNYGWFDGLWGDQEFITREMGADVKPMRGIYSYKYHCRSSLPEDCKVSCFHGKPKPSEVRDEWVTRYRSTATPA